MSRRLRIAIASATILLALGILLVGGFAALTHTGFGQERVRSLIASALKGHVKGRIYIGHISGGFFDGATIDSLEIRDDEDSLFVSTGPIEVRYDARDLLDRRILLSYVRVERPHVVLRQHENGDWNWRLIFPASVQKAGRNERGFGDFVVIDSAQVTDAAVRLTLPWHPEPWLHGVKRDSAIAFELGNAGHEIRHTREGLSRSWRWNGGQASLGYVRLADPDSSGRFATLRSVSIAESDPPFRFRNVRGSVTHLGDSIWVTSTHWDLPASTGTAKGKIVWGSDLPIRYDVHVVGDSVSLRDVAWVYPTLPRSGGGRLDLDIRSTADHKHIDYALSSMDVRTTRSRLLGAMTFRTGGPILIVKDVALQAAPVNFDLLRTLSGKPFPYDWQGDITGTVSGPGGPLNHFRVDQSSLTFADAHVPGAVTRASGRGELDIVVPALTAFHSFDVNVATLDLRTLQYLNPLFPKLKGSVSGTATLDSAWTDVRFRNAMLVHHGGPGAETRASGSGRVTWGKLLTYDLALEMQPVSVTTLALSYPGLPLRGEYTGPVSIKGTATELRVVTELSGPDGKLAFDGVVDADAPVYAARGSAKTTDVNLRGLFGQEKLPVTRLNGTYALDIRGESAETLAGSMTAELAQSLVGETRLESSQAHLRFGEGRITLDTLGVRAVGAFADGSGTVAISPRATGDLRLRLTGDSLASIVRLLPASVRSSLPDSLHGAIAFAGDLLTHDGRADLTGRATGTEVGAGPRGVAHVGADVSVTDLSGRPAFSVTVNALNSAAGALHFDSSAVTVSGTESGGDFRGQLTNKAGVNAQLAGSYAKLGDTTAISLSRLEIQVDSTHKYALTSPAHFRLASGFTLDSLVLRQTANSALSIADVRFAGDSIHGRLRTDSLNLGVLRAFFPTLTSARGKLVANVEVRGLAKQPQLFGQISISRGSAALSNLGTRLENIEADIALSGDSVHIRQLSAETSAEKHGSVRVEGDISFERYDNPAFNLRATAQNFHAIESAGLASLDVSTGPAVTLTGSFQKALLEGTLRVERGTIYIPELIRKNVVDLSDPEFQNAVDTLLARNREVMPKTPRNLSRNLALENVRIEIGQDVWLRSSEANIQLGGSLDVALGPVRAGEPSQLTLEGTLSADRGTYRLNLVDPFVQPTFDVESGTLRFFGTPDLNPSLDIRAIHTVRQPRQSANGRDVRVRATIGGSLSNPQLALDNPDNLPLSQSDLLSYLVTGEPAIGFNNTSSEYSAQLARAALQLGGTLLSNAIPKNVLDIVELQTGSVGGGDATPGVPNSYYYDLLNTRAILGKQVGSRWFLSLSTGLCFVNPTNFFKENLGLQLEYRINQTYTAQAGLEPGSSDASCRPTTARSFQQTPPQLGVDFFKTWRF